MQCPIGNKRALLIHNSNSKLCNPGNEHLLKCNSSLQFSYSVLYHQFIVYSKTCKCVTE